MTFKAASLPSSVLHVIRDKGTEYPFTGAYTDVEAPGTYACRLCGLALFRAKTKFHSGCGWPSFDAEIAGAVRRHVDADGRRTEISCARCDAHLGHVFTGEKMTALNTRHCVNSVSLDFVANENVEDTEEAIVAGGCFWGVEYLFQQLDGVVKTEVGYTGGQRENPTYNEVCSGSTGHLEALRILYDPKKINYEAIIKYFFEIHDPAQSNGQGPDIGSQYHSAVFYYDEIQKKIVESLIRCLAEKNIHATTRVLPVTVFWAAEDYHQSYYAKNGHAPYCHRYTQRF